MSRAEDRRAEVEAENAALRAQVEALLGRIVELEARLAKDSHTSHKPPSSDPLGRKRPRSQRRKSGKKPGGQLGHQGETLHLVALLRDRLARSVKDRRGSVVIRRPSPLVETGAD